MPAARSASASSWRRRQPRSVCASLLPLRADIPSAAQDLATAAKSAAVKKRLERELDTLRETRR